MFKDQLEEFLFHCKFEQNYSQNTVDAYRSDLALYQAFAEKEQLAGLINVENLRAFLADMVREKGHSEATVRRRMASLRSFCRFAAERHGSIDPFNSWKPALKRPKKLPRAVAKTTLKKLTAHTTKTDKTGSETIFCILLLSATGLRVSELCSIRLRDISADGSSIHVIGKGSKDRIVYLGNMRLRKQLALKRSRRMKDTDMEWADAPLLLNSRGNQLRPQTLRRRMHKLVSSKDVRHRITPHSLRHTAATLLIEGGMDIRFVQRQLGHASIATTELYTHVSDDALKHAVFRCNPIAQLTD